MLLHTFHGGSAKVPVDVLVGGEWRTFETITSAAQSVGVTHATLRSHLLRGKTTCNGYRIKYHNEQNMF